MPQGGGSNEHVTRDSQTAAPESAGPEAAGAGTAAALEAKLSELEAQIAQLKEDRLRALAEVENVRRRAARDRQDASQYAISNFARDVLSVADNLQRALSTVDPAMRTADPALDALINGVEMTERELLAVLDRHGVKAIDAEGQPFDPHVHEAMFEIPNPTVPHGTVLQVLQRGYAVHDRTLRPARVGISRGGPKLQPGAVPPVAPEAASPAAPEMEAAVPEPETASAPSSEAPEGETAAAGGELGDDTVVDFRPQQRPAGESYPRQPGGDPRSGSSFDEQH